MENKSKIDTIYIYIYTYFGRGLLHGLTNPYHINQVLDLEKESGSGLSFHLMGIRIRNHQNNLTMLQSKMEIDGFFYFEIDGGKGGGGGIL